MLKQNASLDASFWINSCAGGIVQYVTDYFQVFVPGVVADEVLYPLNVLGMQAYSSILFNTWLEFGQIVLQEPHAPVDWFQAGENAAIALAKEQGYYLLMDDANPYHRVRSVGLHVIGTSEFAVLLFDHNRLSYTAATDAIKQTHASKKQKRDAMVVLETLVRRKGK